MKKTLIALAAVAVTSTAFAQNVTISGRLDMGTTDIKTTMGDAAGQEVNKANTLAGANGTKTGSRITFAGTEDLGGGLTAFFNIESSMGNSGIGNRNLFVGLRGDFGSVQIGRYLNTFSAIRDSHASIAGAPGGAFLNRHLNVLSVVDPDDDGLLPNGLANRSQDTLAYTSPNFSGFTVTVGAARDKNRTTQTGENGYEGGSTNGHSVSVGYSSGPLAARLTTGSGKSKTATFADGQTAGKVSDTAFMVSYDLGFAKPYIMTNNTKGTATEFEGAAVPNTNIKTRATELGATFPMGAFEPFVTVGRGKATLTEIGESEGFKTTAYQIGTNYNLSKRTSMYFAYGQDKIKAREGSGQLKRQGYAAGIVHMF